MKIQFGNASVADFSESENKSNGILQMHVLEVIIIYMGLFQFLHFYPHLYTLLFHLQIP